MKDNLADIRATIAVPAGKSYMLRTCDSQMRAHMLWGGFVWPRSGPVEAPDWSPADQCGRGLHGLLMGEGLGSLLSWEPDAVWLVVEIDAVDVVVITADGGGKIKVPRGNVVYAGDRAGACAYLMERGADAAKMVGGTVSAGDGGTASAGYRGTASAGDRGTASAGDGGTASVGDRGTASAGDRGTASAGYGGDLSFRWWDGAASRHRRTVAYVGEGGILPHTLYRAGPSGIPEMVRALRSEEYPDAVNARLRAASAAKIAGGSK